MPLYDFYCEHCEKVEEHLVKYGDRDKQTCRGCGNSVKRLVTAGRYVPFHSGYYEHFTDKPIYIGSKRELKQACEKYGKGSAYLDDM